MALDEGDRPLHALVAEELPDRVQQQEGLGEAMDSLDVRTMPESEKMATRGW